MLVLLLGAPTSAQAAQDPPILSGRWSSGDCARADAAATRYFAARTTASVNDRCRMAVREASGNLYHVHLVCRFREARPDQDDVVIQVDAPTSLDWIDQCTAVAYHFCGRSEPPHDLPALSAR